MLAVFMLTAEAAFNLPLKLFNRGSTELPDLTICGYSYCPQETGTVSGTDRTYNNIHT
jgi:hypothetical protein